MEANGKADKCHVLIYPKAGHLLEPPISPICTNSYHAIFGENEVSLEGFFIHIDTW